ncbi:hypothetical protein P170DRAFT_463211 [Aspergillus steynii IBT 23096]|uniref:Mid2 domain-containing protein n=1 Tax=Aspergillus steynii IBT 23096 TaxID=1392250 RepID=A0A2I2GL12_9EURO|nr:uncharacterized protein P170DRAFT_463211 [Aspergillus steynii IBT 23096]PLB53561.1 hypothetical protein P170DRAFT_463211 [Aspergillus steynii IBT 23096]
MAMILTPHMSLIHIFFMIFSPVESWVFGWTNSSGETQFESGVETEYRPCTQIHQAKGELVDWDSEEQPVCWQIYRDVDCKNSGGHACHMLSKNASDDFAAFSVYPRDPSATATSTFTTTRTAAASTTNEQAYTTSPTSSTANSSAKGPGPSKRLSGGAIAGVVIGGLIGVAIVAALVYRLARRRKLSVTVNETMKPHSDPSSATSETSEPYIEPSTPAASPVIHSTQPTVELEADSPPVEMSDSHRVVELETPGTLKTNLR